MSDRKTIKIDADAFERHNERRQEMGLSWTEYVDGQAPDAPEVTADVGEVALEATEYEAIARRVAERLR